MTIIMIKDKVDNNNKKTTTLSITINYNVNNNKTKQSCLVSQIYLNNLWHFLNFKTVFIVNQLLDVTS